MLKRSLLLALALASTMSDLSGQLSYASARTLGMGGNTTAYVEEFGAIGVNPAGLAMPGSGFSVAIAPSRASVGLYPVSLSDLADWQGVFVPSSVRQGWLSRIESVDTQTIDIGADVSAFSMSIGKFGLQVSSTATGTVALPSGAAELLLFGNAGLTGAPSDISVSGLSVDAFALSTGAASYAFSVGDAAAIGVTGKYLLGHGLLFGTAPRGGFVSDPVEASLEIPLIAPCEDSLSGDCVSDLMSGGSGFGVDVGFMADLGAIRVGAAVQDVVNTFAWDERALSFRDGSLLVNADSSFVIFDERPLSDAPASLRSRIADMVIRPTLRAGVSFEGLPGFTVTGDVERRIGEGGMLFRPESRMGVGAEFHGLGFIRVQGGASLIAGGQMVSGGVSLVLGPLNMSSAVALRSGDEVGEAATGQVVVSIGGR